MALPASASVPANVGWPPWTERIAKFCKSRPRAVVALAFALFLVVGLLAFADYGVGWDDGASRDGTGLVNWNYVTRGEERPLLKGNEKYHGPAYELFLVLLEKVLDLQDTRAVFLMRHLVLFLTFFLATLAFFQVAKRVLSSHWYALGASMALVLSPRIFAEAFINSKDLVFLSFSVFATWTLFRTLDGPTTLRWAVHALASGLLIDIRILGILHVAVTAACLAVLTVRDDRARLGPNAAKALLYLALTAGFVVLFWPVLWLGPWLHFRAALADMSWYHWVGYVLYLGARVKGTELPWHYLPYWIWISTPILYTLLFVGGSLALAGAAVRSLASPRTLVHDLDLQWLAICVYAFAPVLSVIVLHSEVYDAWRHVFCVYPFIVLIAARGAQGLVGRASAPRIPAALAVTLFAVHSAWIAADMLRTHPHENVYFNELARVLHAPLERSFDQDYWGLSCRQGFERVLALDPAPAHIRVATATQGCRNNVWILPPRERARIEVWYDRASADWFLTNFRNAEERVVAPPPDDRKVYELTVHSVPILAVYRLRP